MRASELIKEIQAFIEENGDLCVSGVTKVGDYIYDDSNFDSLDWDYCNNTMQIIIKNNSGLVPDPEIIDGQ